MTIEIGLYELDDYYDRDAEKEKMEIVADLLGRARELISTIMVAGAEICTEETCHRCKPYNDWLKDFDSLTINKNGE